MSLKKIWNEKNTLIIFNTVSIALICVVFFGGLKVINANEKLIDAYNYTVEKVQERYDDQKKDILLDLMIKNWHRLGNTMLSNDATIAFVMKMSGLVLIGTNLISIYYLIKRKKQATCRAVSGDVPGNDQQTSDGASESE
jgi:hypothetical protein